MACSKRWLISFIGVAGVAAQFPDLPPPGSVHAFDQRAVTRVAEISTLTITDEAGSVLVRTLTNFNLATIPETTEFAAPAIVSGDGVGLVKTDSVPNTLVPLPNGEDITQPIVGAESSTTSIVTATQASLVPELLTTSSANIVKTLTPVVPVQDNIANATLDVVSSPIEGATTANGFSTTNASAPALTSVSVSSAFSNATTVSTSLPSGVARVGPSGVLTFPSFAEGPTNSTSPGRNSTIGGGNGSKPFPSGNSTDSSPDSGNKNRGGSGSSNSTASGTAGRAATTGQGQSTSTFASVVVSGSSTIILAGTAVAQTSASAPMTDAPNSGSSMAPSFMVAIIGFMFGGLFI